MKKPSAGTSPLWNLLLLFAVLLTLYPLLFMFTTSFKSMNQIFAASLNPFAWPPTWDNYEVVLDRFPFFIFLGNTFFIACIVTVGKLVTSTLASFVFVYYDFKGRETLFNAMLLTFFIPTTVLIMLLPAHEPAGAVKYPLGRHSAQPGRRHGDFPPAPDHAGHSQGTVGSGSAGKRRGPDHLRKIVFPLVKPSRPGHWDFLLHQLLERILLAPLDSPGPGQLHPAPGPPDVHQRRRGQ